ncbi:DUF4382 domain-containing protein [Vibrio rarus]|uniref:DUF4382 domain-containing protein n=1 Tax=Vibrio rarus TaxID=413403 RepID=UPI0021C4481B|nr:DUF4382 domain-containing protein [Vibrio rarus]
MKWLKPLALSIALITTLYGCGGDDNSTSNTPTHFSLAVSDAAIDDVASVTVFYPRAVLLPVGSGDPIELTLNFAQGQQSIAVDLLDYQGSKVAPLVTDQLVPAGDYKLCLFTLDGEEQNSALSHVIIGDDAQSGHLAPLQVQGDGACPQGVGKEADAGVLYFNKTFSLNNGNNHFVAEFDLRKGLKEPTGQDAHYTIQRTSVQLVNHVEAGHIKGVVSQDVIANCASGDSDNTVNGIYVYSGTVTQANMLGFNGTPLDNQVLPTTSATVTYNEQSGLFEYEVGFLGEGAYSLGYTCSANKDTLPSIDEFTIYQQADEAVRVTANATVTVNFNEPM